MSIDENTSKLLYVAKIAMSINLHLRYNTEVKNLLIKLMKYIDLLEITDVRFIEKAFNAVDNKLEW